MEKNRVTVLVAGQKFTILSEDPEAYVIDLAAKIDARITALTLKNMTREKAAVLTALDFADDLEKNKKAQEQIKEQMKDYIREISEVSAECESLKAQADKLREEKERERLEKEALQKIVSDLRVSIESFRIESAKVVKQEESAVKAAPAEEPPAEEEKPLPEEAPEEKPSLVTDDGDLSFELPEDERKPVHTPTPPASPKKKRHEHNHENPYKQQFMKKQEEKGYTPRRQYSLFEDEED